MGEQISHVEQSSGTSKELEPKTNTMLTEPASKLVCPPGESTISHETTIAPTDKNDGTRPTAVEAPSHGETNGDSR